jgi:hypothetical protein
MNNEVEERKLHRMAKVHDMLKMWQASQNLCANTEGMSLSKAADDHHGIYFEHCGDRQSIQVTLST